MNTYEQDEIRGAVGRIVDQLAGVVLETPVMLTVFHELTRIALTTYGKTAQSGQLDLGMLTGLRGAVSSALREAPDEF